MECPAWREPLPSEEEAAVLIVDFPEAELLSSSEVPVVAASTTSTDALAAARERCRLTYP